MNARVTVKIDQRLTSWTHCQNAQLEPFRIEFVEPLEREDMHRWVIVPLCSSFRGTNAERFLCRYCQVQVGDRHRRGHERDIT